MKQYLYGHDSEETAYIIEDYPYGFRYRTQMKVWVETNKTHGDRVCRQTLNPKNGRWNKPKKSTYSAVDVLYLDENGHVKSDGVSLGWSDEERLNEFVEAIDTSKLNDLQKSKLKLAFGIQKAQKHVTVTVEQVGPETEQERVERKIKQDKFERGFRSLVAKETAGVDL